MIKYSIKDLKSIKSDTTSIYMTEEELKKWIKMELGWTNESIEDAGWETLKITYKITTGIRVKKLEETYTVELDDETILIESPKMLISKVLMENN